MSTPDKPKPGIFRAVFNGLVEHFFGAVGSGLVAASEPVEGPENTPEKKRRFGWRSVVFLLLSLLCFVGTAVMIAGTISMRSRGVSGEDISLALSIGAGFAIAGLVLVFVTFRRRK